MRAAFSSTHSHLVRRASPLSFARRAFSAATSAQFDFPSGSLSLDYASTPELSGLATLTLNRPKVNALSRPMLEDLLTAARAINTDPNTRALIVRSAFPKVFCAGADLKERRTMTPHQVDAHLQFFRGVFTSLQQIAVPTIAVIDGAALGGGIELALCCDFRVAGAGAKIAFPETGLAIIPGAGGTQRLTRLVGASKAKELIFTGRRLSAKDALELGLVNYAVDDAASESADTPAYQRAVALASEILPQGPVAVRAAKMAIDRGLDVDLDNGLTIEKLCYDKTIPTADRTEGLKAFQEKRKPVYTGK